MRKINVGIVGCGSIAQHRHLPEYDANQLVQIMAVCDPNEERAIMVGQKYGAKYYTNYHCLLENQDIDAVSICTPNFLHAEISIAALRAGKHVLCEKPIATSVEEAERMIEAANQTKKKLMIAHNQRFVRSHKLAKNMIETGKIGKIYSFRTTFGHRGPESWSVDGSNSWFFSKEKACLGSLGDLGVHKADLIRFLLNEEIVEAAAFVDTKAKENCSVDDNAVCILRTESGIIGTLCSSWTYVGEEDNSTIIYGQKGIMRLEDDLRDALIIQYSNGEIERHQLEGIQTNEQGQQSDSKVIDAFIESIATNGDSPISGIEGMKSLQVILAALEANEKKTFIQLNQQGKVSS
ncbi:MULTISPECIES: Gfo/Idh/MocA family protein [Bacillus]|uniref:Gfo/Idh/MocA family protein n=1 Tax=Bacillus TaxID=1386 RepID=UPI0002FC32F7|nr:MULTISPECIES: Gfo/Idh/MocA family oxidoreductase [Bacillus]